MNNYDLVIIHHLVIVQMGQDIYGLVIGPNFDPSQRVYIPQEPYMTSLSENPLLPLKTSLTTSKYFRFVYVVLEFFADIFRFILKN